MLLVFCFPYSVTWQLFPFCLTLIMFCITGCVGVVCVYLFVCMHDTHTGLCVCVCVFVSRYVCVSMCVCVWFC